MIDDENSIAAKHAEDDGDEAFFRAMHDRAKKAMGSATECPHCGQWPVFEFQMVGNHAAVFCERCGEEGGLGFGNTAEEAVAAWNALPPPCVHACGTRADSECSHGRTCRDCLADTCPAAPDQDCPECGGDGCISDGGCGGGCEFCRPFPKCYACNGTGKAAR